MTNVLAHGTAGQDRGFPFVGRQREFNLLLDAVGHPPAVVLVEGEAGIGKSRLVHEASLVLSEQGGRVLMGFCQPLREPFPYGPVVDALRKARDWLPEAGVPPTAGALAPLLPDLADRLPPAPAPVEDPHTRRHLLVQAVHSFLAALGPAVLVVEDLHWVDEATRDLLLLLARDLPDQLALVLTYRAEDLPSATPVLGSAYRRPPGVGGSTIRLGTLAEDDIHSLAAAALGHRATRALGRALYRRSEGLALVVEEDLLTLREQGRQRDSDRDSDTVVDWLHGADAPHGLREAVTERLAALSPAGAAVVDAAAVLAVPSPEPLLAQVTGLHPDESAAGITEAVKASVLRETDAGQYTFRHVLAQQVAYRHVLGPQRRLLHQRVIAELETRQPVPLVQVAHHTRALGDRQAWPRRAEEAADQAITIGDTGTAATLLRQIIEEPHSDDGLRSRSALALAQIGTLGADYTANAALLRRILSDPQLTDATRGEVRLALGLLEATQAGDRAGFRQIERAVDELAGRPERAARAMVALAMNEWDGGVERSGEWMDRAEAAVADSGDDGMRAAVRASRITLMAREGDPGLWSLLEQLPQESENQEVVRQTARAVHNAGTLTAEIGNDARARQLLAGNRHLSDRSGIPYLGVYGRATLLSLDFTGGRWHGLEERLAALADEYPDLILVSIERALLLGGLAAARGRSGQALEHFGVAAAYGDTHTEVSVALRAAAGLVGLRLAQGSPDDAAAAAGPAVAVLRETRAWPRNAGLLPAAVEAALAVGDRSGAERLADEAERALSGRRTPAADAGLHLARGLLLRDAAPADAADRFARARRAWQEIGRPYDAARAAERLGHIETVTRPGTEPRHLTEALETYTLLGASADTARCQRLLRELGLDPSASHRRRGYGDRLSPREREVAELVSRGATNRDIAGALVLSPRTVEQHVARVLHKLGTTRKAVGEALRDLEDQP
ncbi:AAA family ATPase [Streptomyces sp. NA04227]|uniref:ATP-binding protein n=1 Tax=Streptomyces sp. NA04227 TaxID=2742136 RepID=UPI001591B306|nr:AAA family ATPase [Streptomyces sp. NA04227]QKW07893.1 AAA family ATPase [Streptomyces sp. NA04227]